MPLLRFCFFIYLCHSRNMIDVNIASKTFSPMPNEHKHSDFVCFWFQHWFEWTEKKVNHNLIRDSNFGARYYLVLIISAKLYKSWLNKRWLSLFRWVFSIDFEHKLPNIKSTFYFEIQICYEQNVSYSWNSSMEYFFFCCWFASSNRSASIVKWK